MPISPINYPVPQDQKNTLQNNMPQKFTKKEQSSTDQKNNLVSHYTKIKKNNGESRSIQSDFFQIQPNGQQECKKTIALIAELIKNKEYLYLSKSNLNQEKLTNESNDYVQKLLCNIKKLEIEIFDFFPKSYTPLIKIILEQKCAEVIIFKAERKVELLERRSKIYQSTKMCNYENQLIFNELWKEFKEKSDQYHLQASQCEARIPLFVDELPNSNFLTGPNIYPKIKSIDNAYAIRQKKLKCLKEVFESFKNFEVAFRKKEYNLIKNNITAENSIFSQYKKLLDLNLELLSLLITEKDKTTQIEKSFLNEKFYRIDKKNVEKLKHSLLKIIDHHDECFEKISALNLLLANIIIRENESYKEFYDKLLIQFNRISNPNYFFKNMEPPKIHDEFRKMTLNTLEKFRDQYVDIIRESTEIAQKLISWININNLSPEQLFVFENLIPVEYCSG